jgi:hypothetical protein
MEAYRYKNLVYVPLPKHASRSYIHFFRDVLKWRRIETYNIDWTNDVVFAHLVHPITRYVNGVVQVLQQNNLDHLIESEDFLTLLKTSIFFDRHTYPVTRMFDLSQCFQIEWLLLDHDLVTGEEFTQAFLKNYNVEIDIKDILKLNQSTEKKVILREKIRAHTDKILESLIFILQEDLNLYNQVVIYTKFFEINDKPWSEISYKKNFVEKYGFEQLKKTRFNLQ